MNNLRYQFGGVLFSRLLSWDLLSAVAPGPGLPETGSGAHDFDFFFGSWRVHHRRLKERLDGCTAWDQFEGQCQVQPLLGGAANVDDNFLELPGGHYRAATLRSYDAAKQHWSIWWLDGRAPGELDTPVVGRFNNGLGEFHAEMTFRGKPTRVRFRWSQTATGTPRWEQAFSADAGRTWETNWIMDFTPRPATGRPI